MNPVSPEQRLLSTPLPHAGEDANCCGNCGNWSLHEDERMDGMGACTQRPVGHYSPATFACLFDPSRWVRRK